MQQELDKMYINFRKIRKFKIYENIGISKYTKKFVRIKVFENFVYKYFENIDSFFYIYINFPIKFFLRNFQKFL